MISDSAANALEIAVGVTIALLGVRLLRAGELHTHTHRHGAVEHSHSHRHGGEATPHHSLYARPLFVGLLHGTAGSGAITLLIVPTLGSLPLALVYVLVFGIGATLAMVALSSLLGESIGALTRNRLFSRFATTGVAYGSIVYGAAYVYGAF